MQQLLPQPESMVLHFDIETDGLRETLTKIWCITIYDGEDYTHYGPEQIEAAVARLHGNHICAHNAYGFDVPVITQFYPAFQPAKIDDTFILSSLFEPDRFGHGLADWGKQFNVPKPEHEDWTQYSNEMMHRNIEDVKITKLCYDHLMKERVSWDWEPAIRLEYKIAALHAQQEENGVGFDMDAALSLHSKITAEVAEIDSFILRNIPPKWGKQGETINKPFKMNGEYNERVLKWIKQSYPGHSVE